jgi:hypothetical protein
MGVDGPSLQMRIGLSRAGNEEGMQGTVIVLVARAVVPFVVVRAVVIDPFVVVVFAAAVVDGAVLAFDEAAGAARLHGAE